MIKGKTAGAILLAAGNSTRYNPTVNKTLETVGGHAVLWYSIHALAASSEIDEIVIALRETEREQIAALCREAEANKPIRFVIGGATRRESVEKALSVLHTDLILIQDGARPYLLPRFIEESMAALEEYPGVTVGVPSKDTVKLTDAKGQVLQTTDRARTWLVQTPQAFRREELLLAHRAPADSLATDDCMLMEALGLPIKMLMGDYRNIKITTPEDRELMALFLTRRQTNDTEV